MRKIVCLVVIFYVFYVATAFKLTDKFTDPQQCIEEKCPTQWAACQKDPKCKPALDDCDKKCGDKVSCWTLCLASKGSQAATDVAKCAQANDCQHKATTETALAVFDPRQCIEEHCSDQARACGKDAGCFRALQDCERECGQNRTCYGNCIAKKGNPSASAFWQCIVDNNCFDSVSTAVAVQDPQQCIEEKCPTQWAACQKDPKCKPALDDCDKKCGDKVSCWTLCLASKGSQAATDVAKCAQANDCQHKSLRNGIVLAGPQECIEKYCKT